MRRFHKLKTQSAVTILVTVAIIATAPRAFAQGGGVPPSGIGEDAVPPWQIGPIPGLTMGWYAMPSEMTVPIRVVLQFKRTLPRRASIKWTGAKEISRDGEASIAICPLNAVGEVVVRAEVRFPNGAAVESRCIITVVDVTVEHIEVRHIVPTVSPLLLNENSNNEETMRYYYGESVAELTRFAIDKYATSIDREVELSAIVNPSVFAPLVEWRVNDEPVSLGLTAHHTFREIDRNTIVAGPLGRGEPILIDTYKTTITSHTSLQDIVPEGEPVTFEAVTDPPQYAGRIRWISSTLYGTAAPVLGHGPTFTVQFDDTWGPHPQTGEPFQWLGVKADNAAFNQDQKVCVEAGLDCWESGTCADSRTQVDLCGKPIPADFFELGSDPFPGIINLSGDPSQLDTTMERLSRMCFSDDGDPPSMAATPLQIVELHLVGCESILVTGPNPRMWDVAVDLPQERTVVATPASAPIPDCGGGVPLVDAVSVALPNCGQVSSMSVAVQMTHTRVGDLIIQMRHIESNTTVTLMDRPGVGSMDPDGNPCTGDETGGNTMPNLDVTFSDVAANLIDDQGGSLDLAGAVFRPTQPLGAFTGTQWCSPSPALDAWELIVIDSRGVLACSDGTGSCAGRLVDDVCDDLTGTCQYQPVGPGTLDGWQLIFDAPPQPPSGTLTATKTHVNGGTFVSDFQVLPRFTFTSSPDLVRAFVPALPLDMGIPSPASWLHDPAGAPFPCVGDVSRNWWPGYEAALMGGGSCCRPTGHAGPGHIHVTGPPNCSFCADAACCLPDGTCVDVPATVANSPQVICENTLNGTFLGDATTCVDDDNDGIADILEVSLEDPSCCTADPVNICTGGIRTDMRTTDTDGDGACDGCEVYLLNTNPCDDTDPVLCPDCNTNGLCDQCDVYSPCGASEDCDGDGTPDECEPDTDGDGTIDDCDACPNEPALTTPSEPGMELTCNDGIDNDCDGDTDAADTDCP